MAVFSSSIIFFVLILIFHYLAKGCLGTLPYGLLLSYPIDLFMSGFILFYFLFISYIILFDEIIPFDG
jgi:hypothetical protein